MSLPPNFWLTERDHLLAELLPALQTAALSGIAQSAAKLGPLGLAFDPGLVNAAAARWAREHTDQLLNLLGTTNQQVVGQVVANWVETPGATLGDLDAALAPVLDGDVARADMLAVTETTRAIAQGSIMSYSESGAIAPPMWTDKTGTRPFGPPGHPRCILPDNLVMPIGPITSMAKSLYIGRCVEVTLDNGSRFTCTKNHPILTRLGWKPAKFLDERDYVAHTAWPERVTFGIKPDDYNMPVSIEQIFNSFVESNQVLSRGMPASAEDFHGDGRCMNGNINIVYPNGFLLGDIQAELLELRSKFGLYGHDTFAQSFVTNGASNLFIPRNISATHSGVGGADLHHASFVGHLGPFQRFGFRASAMLNTSDKYSFLESDTINASLAREFILRFAGDVSFQKIVKIRNFDFRGHVYDLQCDLFSLYICNGSIVKNCRCDLGMARYKDLYLIFWTTARDDEVCRRPIKTPWSIVQGCRALQGVCISAGEYLGRKIV